MDAIFDILFNLFEGIELRTILESIEGTLIEYDATLVWDTFESFFGGLFG